MSKFYFCPYCPSICQQNWGGVSRDLYIFWIFSRRVITIPSSPRSVNNPEIGLKTLYTKNKSFILNIRLNLRGKKSSVLWVYGFREKISKVSTKIPKFLTKKLLIRREVFKLPKVSQQLKMIRFRIFKLIIREICSHSNIFIKIPQVSSMASKLVCDVVISTWVL